MTRSGGRAPPVTGKSRRRGGAARPERPAGHAIGEREREKLGL
ncbi:hypothetical protein [Streptosporangium sp. NPDC003464]